MRIIPDHSTLIILPWRPTHAMAMVNMHKTPGVCVDARGSTAPYANTCNHHPVPSCSILFHVLGALWACDPRAALARVLDLLHQQHGLSVRLGFEHEFVLLQKSGHSSQATTLPPPVERSNYAQSYAVEQCADGGCLQTYHVF